MSITEQEHRAFAALVNAMRQAQREYFRTRSSAALDKAKTLEKAVDRQIERLFSPQADLFAGEQGE